MSKMHHCVGQAFRPAYCEVEALPYERYTILCSW